MAGSTITPMTTATSPWSVDNHPGGHDREAEHYENQEWAAYRPYNRLAEFGLGSILTFFALALWIEIQNCRIVEIAGELDRVRRENLANQDLDVLTGLLNQSALAKKMEDAGG